MHVLNPHVVCHLRSSLLDIDPIASVRRGGDPEPRPSSVPTVAGGVTSRGICLMSASRMRPLGMDGEPQGVIDQYDPVPSIGVGHGRQGMDGLPYGTERAGTFG